MNVMILEFLFLVICIIHSKSLIKPMALPDKAQKVFDKVVEWDKKLIKKCQDKFGWTDYQVVCISFAKGLVIGALIL